MKKVLALAGLVGVLVAPGVADAALIATLDGSDCAGVFGERFGDCKIPSDYDPNQSPVIAKFDGEWEFNTSLFPTVDGSEWTFSAGPLSTLTGSWTYTPGDGDPVITHWVAKYGNKFNLYDMTGPNPTTWSLEGNALSHLTFYDTGDGDGDGDGGNVPEPGSLVLLGAGLIGLATKLRRRA